MLRDPNNQLCRLAAHLNEQAKTIAPTGSTQFPDVGFRYIDGSRVFNTLRAHMLVAHDAVEADTTLQNKLMEVLFRKYFKEGRDLGQTSELVASAEEVGLSKQVIDDAIINGMQNEALIRKTRSQIASIRGVHGVPYFKFPNGETINGSESIETFAEVLESCLEASK